MKRMYLLGMVMALAAVFCLAAIVQAENLVVNGSFEDIDANSVSNGITGNQLNQKWNAYPDGFTSNGTPLGWRVEWYDYSGDFGTCPFPPTGRPETALLEIQANGVYGGVTADHGSQWAELDADWSGPFSGVSGTIYRNGGVGVCNPALTNGEPSPIRIYQDLNTVLPGAYELKFAFAARPNTSGNGVTTAQNNHLQVMWGGTEVYNNSTTSGTWVQVSQEVTATTNPTRLEFIDRGFPDSYGTLVDSVVVTRVGGTGCTYTQGYWKTHSKNGPASYDDNWANLPNGEDTPFFSCGKSWYEILTTPPKKGDAFLILAHQYIAAYLNLLNGASSTDNEGNPIGLEEMMAQAQTYLSNCTTPGKNDPLRHQYLDVAEFLNSYNEGSLGPSHCF